MKVNNVQSAGKYANKLNFKSVYIVEPTRNPNIGVDLPANYDLLFSYDNSNTIKLYNGLKVDEAKKSLFHYGDIARFVDPNKPSMVLVDDEVKDAHPHIELKKEYQRSVQSLEKKSSKELKSMLTKKELKLVKLKIKANPENKLEILKNAVAQSLRTVFRLKEEQLYSSLSSKVKMLKPEDIQKIKFMA